MSDEMLTAAGASPDSVSDPAGAAAPAVNEGGTPNSTPGDGAGGAAGDPGDGDAGLSVDDLRNELLHAQKQLSRAVEGYSGLQAQLEAERQVRAELQKRIAEQGPEFPKTTEEMVAILKNPDQFRALIQKEARAIAAGNAVNSPQPLGSENAGQAFMENHAAVSLTREVAKMAMDAQLGEAETVQFLVEMGLRMDANGRVIQLPFQWASSPAMAKRLAQDAIRGRVAPAMAKKTIIDAAKAGKVAADAQVKNQLPSGITVNSGGGASSDVEDYVRTIAGF